MKHIPLKISLGLAALLTALGFTALVEDSIASPADAPSRIERVAFHSNRSGSMQIYIMNADGSDVERLTDNSAADVGPVISPDGSKIAFVSNRKGSDHIFLMDIDGNNQRCLTKTPEPEVEPAWSPDGKKIYFRKEIGDRKTALCVIGSNGADFQQLTDGSTRYMTPTISSDGISILCANGSDIWVLDADGRNPRRIAETKGMMVAYPRWSPDGQKIVFGMVTGTPPNHKTDVFIINADGTGEKALTRSEGISEYPCWSPDGTRIVFQTSRDGNFEIYVMNDDGLNLRRLTEDAAMDGRPSCGEVTAGSSHK